MAETLPLRKNVTFASLFDFHLMRVDLLVYKNQEGLCNPMEAQKQNGMTETIPPEYMEW